MPSYKAKHAGVWKDPVQPYGKHSGTWKPALKVFVKSAGTWVQVWSPSGPAATFTPDGGTYLVDVAFGPASYTLTCSVPAVWTFTKIGPGGSESVASGGTSTSITFTVTASDRSVQWNVTGVASGVTKNFNVTIDTYSGSV